MILLDTDIFSLLELPDSAEYMRLRARIAQLDPAQPIATTVIIRVRLDFRAPCSALVR